MDMTLLDVSRLSRVRRGEEVVWIGRSGKVTRTATHLAEEAGTIPWEIFTRIHSDISRVFI
jgi:alanine racemase